eukprot:TRINITY_DN1299_c0_g1_i1.p1 TRINITY_DN1299_c0_g1~~TRINITY_DN1299_c0_g1_i1.p1  ORF type:complete len:341 (+),score=25.29 TRINITY_DN1299_c0_g1_i1:78-1025(+)
MESTLVGPLSQDALTHVLTFLNVKEAARMATVSKKLINAVDWSSLWCELRARRGGFRDDEEGADIGRVLKELELAKPHWKVCDCCEGYPIDGVVYWCMHCSPSLLVCEACFKSVHSWHPSEHVFVSYTKSKWWSRHLKWKARPPQALSQQYPPDSDPPPATPCHICSKEITNKQTTCITCPTTPHMCTSCLSAHDQTHGLYTYPVPIQDKSAPLGVHRCVCDECSARPLETRYRCAWCFDYDRCAGCQADPQKVARHDHPMMLINYPYQRDKVEFAKASGPWFQGDLSSYSSSATSSSSSSAHTADGGNDDEETE